MSLMKPHHIIKIQSTVRVSGFAPQPDATPETRAKKSAEFKKLKVTSTTTEMKKPSCWDSFASILNKADAALIA